jgi:hypothetical protein
MDKLKERKIGGQSVDFPAELQQLLVQELGFELSNLNQEQLDEVDTYVKLMVGNVRMRWTRSKRVHKVMIRKFQYFGEIVNLPSFNCLPPPSRPSTSSGKIIH